MLESSSPAFLLPPTPTPTSNKAGKTKRSEAPSPRWLLLSGLAVTTPESAPRDHAWWDWSVGAEDPERRSGCPGQLRWVKREGVEEGRVATVPAHDRAGDQPP